jgi:hypothetical protein
MATIEMSKLVSSTMVNSDQWNDGPDNLCPSESYVAVNLLDAVKLRLNSNLASDRQKPISIYSAFKKTVDTKPNHPALSFKEKGYWIQMSYKEYWDTCIKAAKSFIKVT